MARNKYPEVTEERILEAAQRLFLEKGYDNTTIQDIVDQLGGLTKGAVYHHFKSKEEILDKVSDRMFFQNNPFEAVKQRGDLNGLEKLREAMRLNQADASRTNLTLQVAEEIKRYFGPKVFKTVVPRNVRLSEAPSHGKPIIAYDRLSRGAEAYTAIADELLRRNKGGR